MTLKSVTKDNFDEYYKLLEQDFIYEERRTKEDEFKALKNKKFKPFFIYLENQLVGYCSYWEFDNFVFGEHFAILKEHRNQLIGFTFIKHVLSNINKLFVFEIELPTDKISTQRKMFYERLKISVNDFEYVQPSYHKGESVPMLFCSYPNKLTQAEFETIKNLIYKEVYLIK